MNEELRQWINVKVGSCPRLLSNTSCLCPSISGKVWIQSRMIGWCGLHFSPVSPCDCTVVSRVNTRAKIKETQQVVVVVVVVGGTICKLSSQKAYQNHDLHQKVAFDLPAPEMNQWLCLPTRLPRKAKNMLHCCTGNEKKGVPCSGRTRAGKRFHQKVRDNMSLYTHWRNSTDGNLRKELSNGVHPSLGLFLESRRQSGAREHQSSVW